MGIGRWGPIACVSLLMVAPSARAQLRRVAPIVVATDPRLEADAVAAGIALRRVLEREACCEPVDLFAIAAGDARSQRARAGAAHLAEAKDLLDHMSYEAALQRADDAVAAYEEADLTNAFPSLLDSIALRALVLHFAKGEGWMEEELVRLFTLKPDYQLDPLRASPVHAPLVARARAEVIGASRVTLEVRSAPTAAEIFVDGISRGIGVVAVPDLAPGAHYVTARAVGRELAQERTLVGLGPPVQVSLKPAAAERGLLQIIEQIRISSPPVADSSAEALARWADASEALVVLLGKKGGRTWAFASLHSLDGRRLAAADGALAKPEDVEALVGKGVVGVERPSRRRTLALALGGGGIAAMATGVVFGLLARRSYEEAKDLASRLEEKPLAAAKSAAKRDMVLANVAYGLGAVALGTGLYIGLTSGKTEVPAAGRLSVAPVPGGGALCFSGGF